MTLLERVGVEVVAWRRTNFWNKASISLSSHLVNHLLHAKPCQVATIQYINEIETGRKKSRLEPVAGRIRLSPEQIIHLQHGRPQLLRCASPVFRGRNVELFALRVEQFSCELNGDCSLISTRLSFFYRDFLGFFPDAILNRPACRLFLLLHAKPIIYRFMLCGAIFYTWSQIA